MKNIENIYGLLNDLSMDLKDYAKEELSEMEKQKLKRPSEERRIAPTPKKLGRSLSHCCWQ